MAFGKRQSSFANALTEPDQPSYDNSRDRDYRANDGYRDSDPRYDGYYDRHDGYYDNRDGYYDRQDREYDNRPRDSQPGYAPYPPSYPSNDPLPSSQSAPRNHDEDYPMHDSYDERRPAPCENSHSDDPHYQRYSSRKRALQRLYNDPDVTGSDADDLEVVRNVFGYNKEPVVVEELLYNKREARRRQRRCDVMAFLGRSVHRVARVVGWRK